MPQINRVRIINFSYNNNNRNIIDETFDFYNGENALLSLKNGGGKSVLVQLLMQPIIPKAKLMGRKIEDFFKGKRLPSYVLVEWKLEDDGGYLLTGIALSNRESNTRDSEEVNNGIKYFTFTSYYREANTFDIKNIPLINRQDDKIFIEEFNSAKKLIIAGEKNRDSKVKFYSEDDEDRSQYRRHLETFNIFQDEWRTIVLKINESEGGVIEIFEKSKTSQQLMNDWIIKSIEKVVNKEEATHRRLEQMLENLVEEVINNEQYIYEKEVYEDFLRESDLYLNELNKLITSLDKQTEIEQNLANLFNYLKEEIVKFDEKKKIELQNIEDSEAELKKIDLEERSKAYYDHLDKVHGLEEKYNELENKLNLLKEKRFYLKEQTLVQKAAREYKSIKELERIISGLKEDIDRIKNNADSKDKIRNLEYSLKISYGELLGELRDRKVNIDNEIRLLGSRLDAYDIEEKTLETRSNDLVDKRARLNQAIEVFESKEEAIKLEIEFNYEKNLLGQIDKKYIDAFSSDLREKKVALDEKKLSISNNIDKLNHRNIEITKLVSDLRAENDRKKMELNKVEIKIDEYYKLEEEIKPIYERFDLDYKRRFNHEEIRSIIKNKIDELSKKERELDLGKRAINDTINSLREGTLHVSKEFRQWLINNDIDFETGENYLRKQNINIRNNLIKVNPILPYAFILYEEDIVKLTSHDIGVNITQLVPIISYKDIGKAYDVDGNFIKVQENMRFMCLLDKKMMDSDDLENYITELEFEKNEIEVQWNHYDNEIREANSSLQLLFNFDFDKNYIYNLEYDRANILDMIKAINIQIYDLDDEKNKNNSKVIQCNVELPKIDILIKELMEKEKRFHDLIKENNEYLNNKKLLGECQEQLYELIREKEVISTKKKEINNKKDELIVSITNLDIDIKEKDKRLKAYENIQDGQLIDDTIENMEERLNTLKSEITYDLNRLEKDLGLKEEEKKQKSLELKSYSLHQEQYVDVVYDYNVLSELETQLKKTERNIEEEEECSRIIYGKLGGARGKLEAALQEINRLGEEPIALKLILLNFNPRREDEKYKIQVSKEKISGLSKLSQDYENISFRIGNIVDVIKHRTEIHYEVLDNVGEDFLRLGKSLSNIKEENQAFENNINSAYNRMRYNYLNKNVNIDNIFKGLDPLIEGAPNDKDKYYYLGERILNNNELLSSLISIQEQRLSNVERNKKDMIQHSYLHSKQVYDEVQKIAENSAINLEGKNRPIPMIKIDMEPLADTVEENINKIGTYIDSCINTIKGDIKEDKKIEEIRKRISRFMSTRELLNVLSDLGKMNIYAYKIDLNMKNSRYKKWEQVMKENSGGERFVSFFAVLVALMSYTRTSMKLQDDYQRNKDTKVLIMDNPFGPISSEHLLKPLFKIAEKYNTQLICLTDLKQNSILNCFNLIYMIKIRQNIFGTSEYMQLEKQIKEEKIKVKDENLEKAIFKTEEFEQISLI